jgi:DNA-binding transcriptional LysR family regulator
MALTVPIQQQSNRFDLNQVATFYWVARGGSFTAGAKALAMPKSSVSRQVAALETRLGVRLLNRTTRKLALTEIGRLYFAHCERVMAEAEQAEQTVTAYTAEARGLLRVGVPVTFARSFLAPLLPGFCRMYPEVKLDLVLRGGRLDPMEALLDVAIHVGRLQDSSYTVRRIGSMGQALYASAAYASSHPLPATLQDLARHSIVAVGRSPRGSRWVLEGPGTPKQEVWTDPRMAVADPVIACQMVESGFGIALLPSFLTRDRPSLVPVLPEWKAPDVEFFALYAPRPLVAPKVRVFLDYLQTHLAL